MAFVIKAAVADTGVKTFSFAAQKTMYGGKAIAVGDTIFIFASENEGGVIPGKTGLIGRGVVTAVDYSGVAKPKGVERYTPRVSITVRRTATAKRKLGRAELRPISARVARAPNAPAASTNRPPTRSSASAMRRRGGSRPSSKAQPAERLGHTRLIYGQGSDALRRPLGRASALPQGQTSLLSLTGVRCKSVDSADQYLT